MNENRNGKLELVISILTLLTTTIKFLEEVLPFIIEHF